MARLLSSTNLAASLMSRRSYSVVAVATRTANEESTMETKAMKSHKEKEGLDETGPSASPSTSPWVPDPITGYYRPMNQLGENDKIHQREMFMPHESQG